jgi:hypothetical protein
MALVITIQIQQLEFEKHFSIEVMQGVIELLVLGREKCWWVVRRLDFENSYRHAISDVRVEAYRGQ